MIAAALQFVGCLAAVATLAAIVALIAAEYLNHLDQEDPWQQ